MGIQVNGIAFWLDRTHVAVSEDHSYIFISYENQIIVFHINPTDSQYEARFRHTAKGKVKSPSWSGDDIYYKIEGDSKEHQIFGLSRYKKAIKNTVSESTALIFLKWRGINTPEDQIMDLQELFRGKLVLEEIPQHQDIKLPKVKLPYEVVQQMTLSMSIGDAENAVEAMLGLKSIAEKERILRERCDPLLFLAEIFKDPERLLDLMRCTGTIISGSRAAEYFCPGACVANSDVDFYCPSDIETVALFTYHLSLMGVEWSNEEPRAEEGEFLDYFEMKLSVLRGTLHHRGRTFDIQCIWSVGQRRTATSMIFQFHSTPVQCFISGFAAVSLYDKYTSVKKAIHWPANDKNTVYGQRQRKYHRKGRLSVVAGKVDEYFPEGNGTRNELKIIEKYSGRGFQFVEYLSQGTLAHGNGDEIGCYGGRFRSVGDSGCRKVSFKPYIKHDHFHIPFDVYLAALDYIVWFETRYKTTSLQGLLEDDFPYQRVSRTPFDKKWDGPNQIFDPMESSYATELMNNGGSTETPWLGDEIILEDLNKIFYSYRYPC